MKKRLPEHTFKHLNHLIGPGSEFMEEFETLKRSFGSSNNQNPFCLPLPIRMGREACGMSGFYTETSEFILTVEDVQSLFDPVVRSVIGLVNSQIQAACREYGRGVINVSTLLLEANFSDMAEIGILENCLCWRTGIVTLPSTRTSMFRSPGKIVHNSDPPGSVSIHN